MINKGFRFSFPHILFYISTIVITTQLWSIWRESKGNYLAFVHKGWHFNADVHANVHTLSHDQCDFAFPELYHSLDAAVGRRKGRKVHVQDIAIAEGRCMLRVMVYEGEVRQGTPFPATPDAYPRSSSSLSMLGSPNTATSQTATSVSASSVPWPKSIAPSPPCQLRTLASPISSSRYPSTIFRADLERRAPSLATPEKKDANTMTFG